ncbi:hypothetical protein F183_A27370 [Bryobacterales bacterium F-183]|nr:hypothetical protein F183_A27370 [Bryobacterales bacterium F-183]
MFLVSLATCSLMAAPKLRLSSAAAGPFSIAQGQNGRTQTVDAFNAGDGELGLSVSSSESWLVASVGGSQSCGQPGGVCFPVRMELQTSQLSKGIYTGFVTVSDPNAIDAPQTISVTVQVGGGVPSNVQMYVPPTGAEVRRTFTTSTSFQASASLSGGPRLRVLGSGGGSFRTVYSYDLVATADEGTPEGEYNGSMTISGSSLSDDNRTVPVRVLVTQKAIAVASVERIQFRIAQGALPVTKIFYLANAGMGGLTVSGVDASTEEGGGWLSGSFDGTAISAVVNADGLAPGRYRGKVTVKSDAANDALEVPVVIEVVPLGAPLISFHGVVTTVGNEPDLLALGDLVTVQGEMFVGAGAGGEKVADGQAWPQSLTGVSVLLNGAPLPVSRTSYGEIDVQIPYDAPEGEGVVYVERDGQMSNGASVQIVRVRPRIFWVTDEGGNFVATAGGGPITPVAAGSTIHFIGAGFGPPTFPVQAGTVSPSDPPATIDPFPAVRFGGSLFNPAPEIAPSYAGLMPGTVGIYQITVTIPQDVNRGERVPVAVSGARDPIFLNVQ